MKRHQFLLILFLLASTVLGMWLFGNWYSHAMAEFTCADRAGDIRACARTIQFPIEIKALVSLLLWSAGGWLLIREWKKQ